MINFIIAVFRIGYILSGLLFLLLAALSPLGKADGGASDLEVFLTSIICVGFAILLFWISIILGKRRKFIIIYIIIVHSLSLLILGLTFIGMLFSSESRLFSYPLFYLAWFVFWVLFSLAPILFFTRLKVKEQFK